MLRKVLQGEFLYSPCKACMGSIEAARSAGSVEAIRANCSTATVAVSRDIG
jgi:hypothetical protein